MSVKTAVVNRWGRRAIWPWVVALLILAKPAAPGQDAEVSPLANAVDLASPSVMTGTLYEIGSDRKTVLFQFRRAATRTGGDVRVEQSFALPDGSVACQESIHYRDNMLVSYETEDLRANTRGTIRVEHDRKKARREWLSLEFFRDRKNGVKTESARDLLEPNTLISDTIYPFILTHWDELMRGTAVKFRFVSLDPPDTFGFRVVKESESAGPGQPTVRIKMEPTNLIIAHLIRPIYFTIEKAAPHRVFSYTGRTTPRVQVKGDWKFVEAEAVFDWK